ncbi:complement C1q tumor necrosis factor-related protein 6-like [Mizuhopecten yessoensis]|uniref:complement C1q tumor necrosis factor-related protein 6-like n=1 Tax=Mizuhopecten yessoensis TaxID=6573 RepID=UPI000B45DFA9|nr:complement C1q tumor necrosis factor-related protein 6-like [Mizuhopecten yessoensis]
MVWFSLTIIILLSTKLIQATPPGNRDDLQDQEITELKKMMVLQSELIQSQAEMLQEYGKRIASLEKENSDLVKRTEKFHTANEIMESRQSHLKQVDLDTRPEVNVHVNTGQSIEEIEDQENGQLQSPGNQDNLTAVGFYCRLQSPNNLLLGQHQTVEFDDVVTNIGNGYDYRHGHFTAPVAGLYSFTSTVLLVTSNNHLMHLAIVKNGVDVGYLFSYSAYDKGTRTVVLPLAVGDMVWVRNNENNTPSINGNGYSTFSGFLITPFSLGS